MQSKVQQEKSEAMNTGTAIFFNTCGEETCSHGESYLLIVWQSTECTFATDKAEQHSIKFTGSRRSLCSGYWGCTKDTLTFFCSHFLALACVGTFLLMFALTLQDTLLQLDSDMCNRCTEEPLCWVGHFATIVSAKRQIFNNFRVLTNQNVSIVASHATVYAINCC